MAISFLLVYCTISIFSGCVLADDSEMWVLKDKIMRLEEILTNHESRIEALETVVVDQDKKIKTLQSELMKIKPEVKIGTRKLNFLTKLLMRQRPINKRATDELLLDSRSRIVQLRGVEIEGSRPILGQAATVPVAFYVYLSQDVSYPAKQQTLIFNVEQTDTANGFNHFSGIFNVPVSGIYVFTSSIAMNGQDAFASYEIMRNADVKGTFFVDAQYTDGYKYSSLTIVIEVEQGDVVFVRTGGLYIIHGSVYSRAHARSSFAGWQLH